MILFYIISSDEMFNITIIFALIKHNINIREIIILKYYYEFSLFSSQNKY